MCLILIWILETLSKEIDDLLENIIDIMSNHCFVLLPCNKINETLNDSF